MHRTPFNAITPSAVSRRRSLLATGLASAMLALISVASGADAVPACATVESMPAVPSTAKRFVRVSATDNAAAIQSAINALTTGDWLVFAPDTYNIGKNLKIAVSGVTLYGVGATLNSTNPDDGGVMIQADNVTVYGFKLVQTYVGRKTTPWASGIAVYDDRGGTRRRVLGATIRNNTINTASSAGIFLYKADTFLVANNTVWRSGADGIHMTAGASNGRVITNSVSQNGDDMIAVVSYTGADKTKPAAERYANWTGMQGSLSRNIYIGSNQVSGNYWGRGITVVGGSDVTIENNSVSKVPWAGGIYLRRETSYVTFGMNNILIRNNTITDIQTLAPEFEPPSFTKAGVLTRHGAIEVGADLLADEDNATYRDRFGISNIAILGNAIDSAEFAAIRIGVGAGPVRDVSVQGNDLSRVGTSRIVDANPSLNSGTLTCANNTLNGTSWPSQCDPAIPLSTRVISAPGATMQCAVHTVTTTPNPPDNVIVN